MGEGSLIVVGTGISPVGQLTTEAIAWMRRADKVLYIVSNPVSVAVIQDLNPRGAESLVGLYADGKLRTDTYEEMVERVLTCVRAGQLTCLALYGHPGVFAYPSHEAIRRARREGYRAQMLPGISAEDCLFADLGVDPKTGCQSYEATDFLLYRRPLDVSSAVILWQIGAIGDWTYKQERYDLSALPLLVERLLPFYSEDHEVCLYQASTLPGCEPTIRRLPLKRLAEADIPPSMTLYIPPARPPEVDEAMVERLRALRAPQGGR
ncbi:hypothetical protein JRI60_50275 [Archangium violaceum]|uniref:SAM-dependent methyltransferase n=1 Tax=Archangium violaceum TaxID=83451 RepID=UPI00194DEE71|nr:SAM-dependent methyltransferase [Archangium violaceum]QRN97057.1 hypothetical protein JRI60_50275 [Archangium violaceum]